MLDKLSTNELKNLCDSLLREFLIRNSQKNEFGFIHCPITNQWLRKSELNVCHIIDRGKMSTRFHPLNVFLGSAYSNLFESKIMIKGYQSLHHKKIEDWFGKDTINTLKEISKERKLYSREDYIDLINFYRGEESVDNEDRQHEYS